MLYTTALADPPWPERGGGKVKRGADRHYRVMSIDDICALRVSELLASDAHLYLWVTNNYLPEGLRVMAAWGFRYVTNIAWGKVSEVPSDEERRLRASVDPEGGDVVAYPGMGRDLRSALDAPPRVQQGLGQYFRGTHELLLFGVRGRVPYRTLADGRRAQHPSLVLAPRGEHSRKPEVFRRVVEKVSPGPYLELFAREKAPGWASWGNEVSCDVKVAHAQETLELFECDA